jgi:hypothetical protein
MRRRNDPFEKPWVIIAAVAGIIAVVIIALVFFMGGGPSAPAGSPGQTQGTSANPTAQQTAGVGGAPSVIRTQAVVTVPEEGVYVRVSYLGGFAGTYGMEGNMTTMRNSGDRVFVVEDATGPVSATFHKEDSSTRHEIVVEIYKAGKVQQVAKNSSPYGEVSVTWTV